MELADEIIKGRKTFFIAPDDSLLSQSFLEEYFAKDYECYFVKNDIKTSLDAKIQTIVSLFTDCIIFINIDCRAGNIDWPEFISQLNQENPGICIGVLYSKRNTQAQKAEIEHRYLYEIGITGGCIQLEYQKNNNFVLIEKVLYLNQAKGRRKTIRAVCIKNCFFNYEDKSGQRITKEINDISVTHFSITIPKDDDFDLPEYERLHNVIFVIKGMRFVSDAVLYMKRPTEEGTLYVFAFLSDNEKIGLDDLKKHHMIQKMFEIINDNCTKLLNEKLNEVEQQKRESVEENSDSSLGKFA